jgi:hypothetical protein
MGQPRSRVRNVSVCGLCASAAKNSTQDRLSILRFATKNRTRENSRMANPAKDIAVRVGRPSMLIATSFMLTKLRLAFKSSNTYHSLARGLIRAARLS